MVGYNVDASICKLIGSLGGLIRRFVFRVLSVGPIPKHIAFIMDGNRRHAKKRNLGVGIGHKAGFLSLVSMLKYCYEAGVKYVTVYAFGIDNFKRSPEEVQFLMDLMLEKIEGLLERESILYQHGVRLYFIGNLKLLSEAVTIGMEKAMKATEKNTRCVLLVCVAYSSADEITHAVHQSCKNKLHDTSNHVGEIVKLGDIEKEMYMAVAPDPDILVRSSGEMRLSNFLLWQTSYCPLYSPASLWPEIGLRHLIWGILHYQINFSYVDRKQKTEIVEEFKG